jgi:hypothetical protein
MSRLLLTGLSAVAATLAGSLGALLWTSGAGKSVKSAEQPAVEVLKLEPVSVPVIRGGAVQGYVIARASFLVDAAYAKTSRPQASAYAGEAAFRAIFAESVDFAHLKPIELGGLADRMAALANERLGRAVFSRATIDNLSFVAKSEIRQSGSR